MWTCSPSNMRRRRPGSALADRCQGGAPAVRQVHRPPGRAIDQHMDELALRRSLGAAVGKYADPVVDTRPAELSDRKADLDLLRKFERREIGAARLDDQRDRVAALDVEEALVDQPAVHGAVEPLVE